MPSRSGRPRFKTRTRPTPPVAPPAPGPASPPSPESVVRDLIEQTAGVASPEPLPQRTIVPLPGPARILFMDLDGTLTNGVITFDAVGDQRHFFIRDGLSLQWAARHGIRPVVISGRPSKAALLRMKDLELESYLGVKDKVAVADKVRRREKAEWKQCIMVGDDLPDVALMKRVGWAVAVADAVPEVRQVAHTVTRARAGYGAIREVVETLLRHNGDWSKVLAEYEVE